MEVKCRYIPGGKYAEVTVVEGGTTMDTGLLDCKERCELAWNLREVAEELDPEVDE